MRSIIREILLRPSISDTLLLGRIVVFALLLPLALRRRDLTSLASFVEPRRSRGVASESLADKTLRYADAVCASRLIRAECLVRGLTRYYFLRRAGVSLSLVFGMGTVEGRLIGHCWLVRDGRPFREPIDPGPCYVPFLTFPVVSVSRAV